MKKITNWIKDRLCRIIMWASKERIAAEIQRQSIRTTEQISADLIRRMNKQWEDIYRQLNALQAIDVSVDGYDRGKIILISTVGGQDIVKIIDIPRGMTMREQKDLVLDLQHRYGVRPEFVDGPPGCRQFMGFDGDGVTRGGRRFHG